jgi:CheY-like chemotaxis protein
MTTRILLVEDEARIAEVVQQYLEREGYMVVWRGAGGGGGRPPPPAPSHARLPTSLAAVPPPSARGHPRR